MVTLLSFYVLALLLSSSTSESDVSLAVRDASIVAGSFARPSSPCAPLPVSPLPCLCPDTVWLVLWLVTVLQGPCQMFVLRESAGLALFRSLTVPLLGSVPSCCCRFTLRCPFFNFLGLAVLADASTAFAIVSHQLILFEHNWHYSPPVRSLANSHSLVPNNCHIPLSCHAGGPVVSHACSRRCHH